MAETAKPKGKLKPWQYAAVLGGAVVVYVVYQRAKNTAATTAASGTSDANTVPGGNTTTTSTDSTSAALPATLEAWIQAVISGTSGANYSPSQSLNDVESWLSGQCVSAQGFSAIGSAIETLGLPPGYNTGVSPLSVCPDTTAPATTTSVADTSAPSPAAPSNTPAVPALSTALQAALAQNNETIVDAIYNQYSNTFDYLTNKGGIYTQGGPGASNPGGTFYGSYLGLAGQQGNNPGQFEKLTALPNGGYTLLDTAGQTYNFGPNVNPTTGVAS